MRQASARTLVEPDVDGVDMGRLNAENAHIPVAIMTCDGRSKTLKMASSRACHFFDNMVDAHEVREMKGVSPHIGWLRFIGLGLGLEG